MKSFLSLCLLLSLCPFSLSAAPESDLPQIGAQVFIEPGQTARDIEDWFRILQENGMTVCRIRMFETHMHRADGTWDFALYDEAFRAAERHGVRVFATLFPADATVGGFKYPRSEAHLAEVAVYIQALAAHFKAFPALYGWVLQNEPGTGGSYTDSDLARRLRKTWESSRPKTDAPSGGFKETSFDNEAFQRFYTTWYLNWLADQLRAVDPGRHLHVNNHAIFSNFPEYDFPAWRAFLTTLGASAHPSWHFGIFRREQFALALSANDDIIRFGAGPLPFWLTELQGGNNLYSGGKPICPTKEETTQWLWTTLGCGAKGVIFWSLNPRAAIDEPGEWALITFQREPSDRLTAAHGVIRTLADHAALFANARPVPSGVTLLLAREAFWTDKKQRLGGHETYEARQGGAPMKSALAWYEALMANGIAADLAEMDAFDWDQPSYKGRVAVLAHQLAIPSRDGPRLSRFVERGGKLIVTGATGYFDEHQVCVMQTGFPLADLLGGSVSEFKALGERFEIPLRDGPVLPAHLWRGTIKNASGTPLATTAEGDVLATRHAFGAGETLWLPSLVGMGAWQRDNAALAQFARRETLAAVPPLPVVFQRPERLVLLRTLAVDGGFVTVMINKDSERKALPLTVRKGLVPHLLFADKGGRLSTTEAALAPEETLVAHWRDDEPK